MLEKRDEIREFEDEEIVTRGRSWIETEWVGERKRLGGLFD